MDPRPDTATAAIIRALERDCGYWREPCAWCVAVGGPQRECIACNGRGYFLREFVQHKPDG